MWLRSEHLWFLSTAIVAALLCGLALLAPRLERNRLLQEQCYSRQLHLLELEQQNETRHFLLQKLQSDPDLLSQLEIDSGQKQDQHISLPEILSIHPDALLHTEQKSAAKSSSTDDAAKSHSSLVRWWEKIARSANWQNRLYLAAAVLLILGNIPWQRLRLKRIRQRSSGQLQRWFRRYLQHPAHPEVTTPHWSTENRNRSLNEE